MIPNMSTLDSFLKLISHSNFAFLVIFKKHYVLSCLLEHKSSITDQDTVTLTQLTNTTFKSTRLNATISFLNNMQSYSLLVVILHIQGSGLIL